MSDLVKITEGLYEGSDVHPSTRHSIPLNKKYVPWHQGYLSDQDADRYIEFAHIGDDWSKVSRDAHRIRIGIRTDFTNERRESDWKGYDYVFPAVYTSILFNDRKVYEVYGWPGDVTRHLLEVARTIEQLQAGVPVAWWTDEDIETLRGRPIQYEGYDGTVVDPFSVLDQGCVIVDVPKYKNYYDESTQFKTTMLNPKLNWYSPLPVQDDTL